MVSLFRTRYTKKASHQRSLISNIEERKEKEAQQSTHQLCFEKLVWRTERSGASCSTGWSDRCKAVTSILCRTEAGTAGSMPDVHCAVCHLLQSIWLLFPGYCWAIAGRLAKTKTKDKHEAPISMSFNVSHQQVWGAEDEK